jgi:hypothetical protein
LIGALEYILQGVGQRSRALELVAARDILDQGRDTYVDAGMRRIRLPGDS